MEARFKDYVVVIFGGTSGIGLCTAIEFIEQGAKCVIICGRSIWKWKRARDKIYEKFTGEKLINEPKSELNESKTDLIETKTESIEPKSESIGRVRSHYAIRPPSVDTMKVNEPAGQNITKKVITKSASQEFSKEFLECENPEPNNIIKINKIEFDTITFKNKMLVYDETIGYNQILEYKQCDVRLENDVENVIKSTIDKYDCVNVYFNNAGVQPIWGTSDGDITKLEIKSEIDKNDGSIIYRIPSPQPTTRCEGINMTYSELNPSKKDNESKKCHEIIKNCSTPTSIFCENPIATSVIGMLYCLKWEVRYFFNSKKQVPLSIINTNSRFGINIPSPERPIYSASKAFINSLTQSIASQVAQKSFGEGLTRIGITIRINGIAPGIILTPLELPLFVEKENVFGKLTDRDIFNFDDNSKKHIPLAQTGRTNQVAPVVLFLADYNQSSYITGVTIPIDGGYSASPVL